MCADDEVADARHYMWQYLNALYGQVRKALYLKVKEKVRSISTKLWEVFADTVVLKNEMLADKAGKSVGGLLATWDTTSGGMHALRTKTAAEETIDEEDYKKFLEYYGDGLLKSLWRPMYLERSREMSLMVANDHAS